MASPLIQIQAAGGCLVSYPSTHFVDGYEHRVGDINVEYPIPPALDPKVVFAPKARTFYISEETDVE